jgi:hypothetical protein
LDAAAAAAAAAAFPKPRAPKEDARLTDLPWSPACDETGLTEKQGSSGFALFQKLCSSKGVGGTIRKVHWEAARRQAQVGERAGSAPPAAGGAGAGVKRVKSGSVKRRERREREREREERKDAEMDEV